MAHNYHLSISTEEAERGTLSVPDQPGSGGPRL